MSIDEFGGNPLRSLPPTSSIRQKKIEQNGKKQHKKRQLPQLTQVEKRKFTLVALVAKKIEQNGKSNTKKNGHLPLVARPSWGPIDTRPADNVGK